MTTTLRQNRAASRDALDIAGNMLEGAVVITTAASVLFHYPADQDARREARNAARQVIADCDALERLT